jgi:RNase P/RNase MRP subunit POP5
MRLKQRHYICDLSYSVSPSADRSNFTVTDIYHALKNEIRVKFGDDIWNKVASMIAVKYYNPTTNLVLIRGPLAHQQIIKSCIENINQIKKRQVSISVLQTSGALRKLKQYMIVWHEKKLFELKKSKVLDERSMVDEINSLFR